MRIASLHRSQAAPRLAGTVGYSVDVLLGRGDGTFERPLTFEAPGGKAVGLTVGDFSGDGRLDVATLNYGGGVGILLGAACPSGADGGTDAAGGDGG